MGWMDIFRGICKKRRPKPTSSDVLRKAVERRALDVQSRYNLDSTGTIDSATMRRMMTELEAEKIENKNYKHIICNGLPVKIEWDKVKLHTDVDGMYLPPKTYRRKFTKERNPKLFMIHWDVCLSSKSCFKVLKNRNLSVHFMIDNDGTIHQVMDTQHAGKHSGSSKVDLESIGVEVSDAYYMKYQKTYEKMGLPKRPIWKNDVKHAADKGDEFLGFYDVQIEAIKALTKALHLAHNIPLEVPKDEDGKLMKTVHLPSKNAKFRGVVCHYHVTTRKIDCAALKLDEIVKEIKDKIE